jgi:periplasmic divalent cation tolerance protein
VLTTVGSAADAKRIARQLVEERLAACVSVSPVESYYVWEGALTEDFEVLLLIKTSKERIPDLERRLGAIHPYAVPEFVVVAPEHVAAPYREWLLESVRA